MKSKKRFWPMAVLAAFATVVVGFSWGSAYARGGRGGGGGRGGFTPSGGGGGRGGRGGNNARNSERKEEQKRQRRDERMARAATARVEYAKRERDEVWQAEAEDRMNELIARVLGGASE